MSVYVCVGNNLARVEGHAFIFDGSLNQYTRKPERRTRLIGLGDSGFIINILPLAADIDAAIYTFTRDGEMVVTDGKNFSLDINEFGSKR